MVCGRLMAIISFNSHHYTRDSPLNLKEPESLLNAENLERSVSVALDEAKRCGADQAEAGIGASDGFSVSVRLGDVETVERDVSHSMSITVYVKGAKGSATTTDLSDESIKSTVASACSIASFTQADEYAGLADKALMASDYPDLDLYHPWGGNMQENLNQAISMATACEDSARTHDARISNSEGATLASHQGYSVYANSHGFLGGRWGTRHSLSCSVVAGQGDAMERDYWYSADRNFNRLLSPEEVGETAAQRALARLHPKKMATQVVPVLFSPEMSRSLVGHLFSAISGGALYRKASFLLDKKGERLFPEFVHIDERPHLRAALNSAAYDSDGVGTQSRDWVKNGVLQNYVLSAYSARRLGLETTGNAGGVRNVFVKPSSDQLDHNAMLNELDTGLLVTEMMGHGLNTLTGDYSRGAAGFWVENGEIQYPVSGVTVAGNMLSMFNQIVAIGADVSQPSNINTGSILIDQLTVAGD